MGLVVDFYTRRPVGKSVASHRDMGTIGEVSGIAVHVFQNLADGRFEVVSHIPDGGLEFIAWSDDQHHATVIAKGVLRGLEIAADWFPLDSGDL